MAVRAQVPRVPRHGLLAGQRCTIYSKRGNAFSRFDELRRRLCAELPKLEVILDGEIVAIDDEGRIDFWGRSW